MLPNSTDLHSSSLFTHKYIKNKHNQKSEKRKKNRKRQIYLQRQTVRKNEKIGTNVQNAQRERER